MSRQERERIEALSKSIKGIEKRISDLTRDVKNESNVRKKKSMQDSLRVNKAILEQLKQAFWRDDEKEY